MEINIDLVEDSFVDFSEHKTKKKTQKKVHSPPKEKSKSKSLSKPKKPKAKKEPKKAPIKAMKIKKSKSPPKPKAKKTPIKKVKKSKSKSKSLPKKPVKIKETKKTTDSLKLNLVKKEPNERKNRGLSQKIFMIEHRKNNEFDMEFDVMGTTKNVYTVKMNKTPTCTCPDHTTRYRRCKHIYFIMRRIMKIDEEIEDKDSFSNTELKTMIKNMPNIMKDLVVTDAIKNRYGSLKNKKTNGVVDMKELDDVCCVCFDDLDNGDEIDYCKYNCGKPIHKDCFEMYCAMKQKKCLVCGNQWIIDIETNDDSYINLA